MFDSPKLGRNNSPYYIKNDIRMGDNMFLCDFTTDKHGKGVTQFGLFKWEHGAFVPVASGKLRTIRGSKAYAIMVEDKWDHPVGFEAKLLGDDPKNLRIAVNMLVHAALKLWAEDMLDFNPFLNYGEELYGKD